MEERSRSQKTAFGRQTEPEDRVEEKGKLQCLLELGAWLHLHVARPPEKCFYVEDVRSLFSSDAISFRSVFPSSFCFFLSPFFVYGSFPFSSHSLRIREITRRVPRIVSFLITIPSLRSHLSCLFLFFIVALSIGVRGDLGASVPTTVGFLGDNAR